MPQIKQLNAIKLVIEKEIKKKFRILKEAGQIDLMNSFKLSRNRQFPSYANCIKTQTRLDFI